MSILLLETLHADAETLLRSHAEVFNVGEAADAPFEPADVEAILTRGRGRVTRTLMERCQKLRVVARCGVGLDNVDTAAAQALGKTVIYAPGTTTTAVAEHTLMLMLAAARRLRPVAEAVHQGNWAIRNGYEGIELAGKTLGIIGFGQIGRRVAELGRSLGMQVVVWSRSGSGPYPALALDELLRTADVVSLHVALTPETRHLIGAEALQTMRPGALLINTARGAIIDEQALQDALREGRLGGFAADVLEEEPPAPDNTLLDHPHAIITPHIAALTETTYRRICVETAANVLAVLRGKAPAEGAVYRRE
jgi:D-3-phosphoglycerate dehydrogenase